MTAGEARTAEQGRAGDEVLPVSEAASGQHAESTGQAGEQVWPDRQALEGPFTTRQLLRLDEALRTADLSTGLVFSVYVGELDEPVRQHAEQLHRQLAGAGPVGADRGLAQPAGAGDRHRGGGASPAA